MKEGNKGGFTVLSLTTNIIFFLASQVYRYRCLCEDGFF